MAQSRGTERIAPSGLGRLHRAYGDWLSRVLRQRFGWQLGEDLEQETWLRVAPIADQTIRYPKALLIRIATNVAIDGARRSLRSTSQAAPMVGEVSSQPPQEEAIALRQIILGLPEPLRDVFLLSRLGGLTNSQIAGQLGISVKTVEKRMTKALAHCAAQLRL